LQINFQFFWKSKNCKIYAFLRKSIYAIILIDKDTYTGNFGIEISIPKIK